MMCKKSEFKAILFLNVLIIISWVVSPSFVSAQTSGQLDLQALFERDKYSVPQGHVEYKLFLKTSDEADAGTDSNIYITICGYTAVGTGRTPDCTPEHFIRPGAHFYDRNDRIVLAGEANTYYVAESEGDRLERNSVHQVSITTKNVGYPTSISIRKDNYGPAPDWKLEYIEFETLGTSSKILRVNADKWFGSPPTNSHTFSTEDTPGSFNKTEYSLQIYTGDVAGAGTDSNIFLKIEGISWGDRPIVSPEIRLNGLASGNLFERHQLDTINIPDQIDLMRLTKITIRSDGKYPGAGWFLGWLKISNRRLSQTIQVDDWIEDGKLTKEFVVPEKKERPDPLSIPRVPARLNCGINDWLGIWKTNFGQVSFSIGTEKELAGELNGIPFPLVETPTKCIFSGTVRGSSGDSDDAVLFVLQQGKRNFKGIRTKTLSSSDYEEFNGTKTSDSPPNGPLSRDGGDSQTGRPDPSQNTCSAEDWAGNWDTSLFPEMILQGTSGGFNGTFAPMGFQIRADFEGSNRCIIKGTWSLPGTGPVGAFRFIMTVKGNFEGAYVGSNEIGKDLSGMTSTWRGRKKGIAPAASQTTPSPARVKSTTQPAATVRPPDPVPVNVAAGKPARQSSTGFGGAAGRAVDGNTDGNWASNSVTHTNSDAGAWWEVDLGALYNISQIRLFNRTDCCGERLKQFRISVSAEPFSSNLDGTEYAPLQGSVDTNPWMFGKATEARYVRIYLNGTGVLSLAEVQVFGTPVR